MFVYWVFQLSTKLPIVHAEMENSCANGQSAGLTITWDYNYINSSATYRIISKSSWVWELIQGLFYSVFSRRFPS